MTLFYRTQNVSTSKASKNKLYLSDSSDSEEETHKNNIMEKHDSDLSSESESDMPSTNYMTKPKKHDFKSNFQIQLDQAKLQLDQAMAKWKVSLFIKV